MYTQNFIQCLRDFQRGQRESRLSSLPLLSFFLSMFYAFTSIFDVFAQVLCLILPGKLSPFSPFSSFYLCWSSFRSRTVFEIIFIV